MSRTNALLLALVIVGALHMSEQILFGVEEFHMLRGAVGDYLALFPAEFADRASVALITIAGTLLSLLCWAFALGGTPRLVALGVFGLFGVSEAHHLVEAVFKSGYEPGLITSVAYVGFGAWLVVEVWRELRGRRGLPSVAAA